MYLTLEHVTKRFPARGGSGEVTAVEAVSLSIQRGQFVTLLGPSGCGKTTTLRLIAGFEFPSEGRITLDGADMTHVPPNQRDMSMVFQSYAIFPHLSVFENIAYGLKIRKQSGDEIRRRVGRVLEMTNLTGLEGRAPNQLSGGQQQRVALARAIVMEPKVLLFDEPLSNLDAKLRVQMRNDIRALQQDLQITSVYVTHDQSEAMAVSDLIVVMNRGRIEQAGSAMDLYQRPVTHFVADFIGQANFIPARVVGSDNGRLRVATWGQTLAVPRPDHPLAEGAEVVLVVRPEGVRLAADGEGVPGVVQRVAYLGSQVDYEVMVDGATMTVVDSDPRRPAVYQRHEPVCVQLLPDTAYVLPLADG
jgi:iron(III) transport system ATP-binding protein